jgi:3-deoxy-manno-octulosonate cytidylyltransferase (CMP-KDO synthetase)
MIQHVYELARACPDVGTVLVATDDQRIVEAVTAFGGQTLYMTTPYRTGTDRVAAVAEQQPGEVFVDMQADEIPMHPGLLSDLITPFLHSSASMGTLRRSLTSVEELRNPGVVKVVTNQEGHALYFSRAPIPHYRDLASTELPAQLQYIHLGIYIYTRATLTRLAGLPTGALEDAEKLEQLRALEFGIPIRVWDTTHDSLRVDTPEDLAQAASILEKRA